MQRSGGGVFEVGGEDVKRERSEGWMQSEGR